MAACLDRIPDDLLQYHIIEMLNPKEIATLGSCNSRLRSVLPNSPLRIFIMNNDSVLKHTLFVSEFPSGRILSKDEKLRYGQHYRFWRFDYRRGHRCDLISHLPLEEGEGYDLAFVAWQRTQYDRCNRRTWIVECGSNHTNDIREGDIIPWGLDITLMVEGSAEYPAFNCHAKRRYLSTYSIVEESEDDESEDGEIAGEIGWGVFDSPNDDKFKIIQAEDYSKMTEKTNNLIEEIRLKTRATPVFHSDDGACAFYTKRSLEGGGLDFGREQIVIFFELWTKKGMLHMKTDQLSFEFVVPMTRRKPHTPAYRHLRKEHPLMETLWNIDKGYANPVISFLGTAANCLLWDGEYPNNTLKRFSRLSNIGHCDDDAQQFILTEDTSLNGKVFPLQKPEYANIPRGLKRNTFFCVFTRPSF